jgi:SseB protein N-terminal domain
VFHPVGEQRFRDDDGSADLAVATALSAFAAAEGSEHAALTALSGIRLLVPLVAALTPDTPPPAGPESVDSEPARPGPVSPRSGGERSGGERSGGERAGGERAGRPDAGSSDACHPAVGGGEASGEKGSEMALPTLVGRDGRRAIPAFTCLEALARWQPSARPVPADAALVWRAAVEDSCSVVIDVAGPVPLAVEGARLAALADGAPVPLPPDDPDVRDVIAAVLTEAAAAAGFMLDACSFVLRGAEPDGDLLIEVAVPATLGNAAAEDFAARVGSAVLDRLAPRLRRGIAIAIAP